MKTKDTKVSTKEGKARWLKGLLAASWWQIGTNISSAIYTQGTIMNRTQLYEIYKQNADVRQSARKIAQYVGIGGIRLKTTTGDYLDKSKNEKIYEEIEFILSNPTFLNTKIEIIKHSVVCGEIYMIPTTNIIDGKMNGLQILDPRTIQKIKKDGQIVEFIQTKPGGGWTQSYTPFPLQATDQKPLLKYFQYEKHINDETVWMWLVESIIRDCLGDMEASKKNYIYFENNMTPPSMFILDPDLSEEEQEILVEQLREQYSGTKNSFKPVIGAGIKDVKMLSISPKDMEHIQQRKMTTDKVCSAIGVPKIILGYTEDVNLNNGETTKIEFIEWTVIPRQGFLQYILNEILQDFFDLKYIIELIWPESPAISKEKDMFMKEIEAGTKTIDEYRVKFGDVPYGLIGFSDKPLIKKTLTLLEDVGMDFSWTWLPT